MNAPMFPTADYAQAQATGDPAKIRDVIIRHARAVEWWQTESNKSDWTVVPFIGTVQLTVRPLPKETPMWLISIKLATVLALGYLGWVLLL